MLIALLMLSLAQARPIAIQDEGLSLGMIGTINCSGSGITCTRTPATGTATITVSGGGGGVPDSIPVVTYSASADLSAERVLSAGNYTVIDNATAAQSQVDWQHGLTCSSGQALTSSGTTAMACTSTITASDLACAGTCVSDAEIAAVAASKLTGVVVAANGGLGQAQPTCGAGAFISCNGTLCSCATPAGANSVEALIDFGASGDTNASVTLTGQTWVTATSKIVCGISSAATGDRAEGAEDAVIEEIVVSWHSRVVGTGFTVTAAAANGRAIGKFYVHCIGV